MAKLAKPVTATSSTPVARASTTQIKAKAEDEKGLVGEESTFEVTIKRARTVYHPLLLRLFERFPNAFPILRNLLGLE